MKLRVAVVWIAVVAGVAAAWGGAVRKSVLEPEDFKGYIEQFNLTDNELYSQYVTNDSAWAFLKENIPFFECPDKEVETTYYFRWWTLRKHIKQTPTGFIITEFLPTVSWSDKYNSINCPAGHHFREGRWLTDNTYLNRYANFWFTEGNPRIYSFWAANSLLEYYKVTGDTIVLELLPELVDNYRQWETGFTRNGIFIGLNPDGLFSMMDGYDGMEYQIGGSGKRPTINSYMYGDALAIAQIAEMTGDTELRDEFNRKAESLKNLVETRLWDKDARFFKTISNVTDSLVDVRELQGYTPWYMNLPTDNEEFASAWDFLKRSDGFNAPYGLTTAEQSHPKFQLSDENGCMWDGRSWPFATSVTLTALANLLNNYHQTALTPSDYFAEFIKYSRAQRLTNENGTTQAWIDESQDPYTGDWMTRSYILKHLGETEGDIVERGKDYNHSTYCDLLISGLIGIRPQADNSVTVNPLVPDGVWDWFCLDRVPYKGHFLTVVYDRYGSRYNLGKGLSVLVDNELKSQLPTLGKITIEL